MARDIESGEIIPGADPSLSNQLDAIAWVVIAIGLYVTYLAVKAAIYGQEPNKNTPPFDKALIYYGKSCLAFSAIFVSLLAIYELFMLFLKLIRWLSS